MMEQISPNVHDDGIKNADGKPIAGGQLFRKYLLNRCQEDFERGWATKEATAAAAASKAGEDEAAKAAAEGTEEAALYSEEYYAAQKAKRQGLGLIKFIGELFKLQTRTFITHIPYRGAGPALQDLVADRPERLFHVGRPDTDTGGGGREGREECADGGGAERTKQGHSRSVMPSVRARR